jgi:hypothetical protein
MMIALFCVTGCSQHSGDPVKPERQFSVDRSLLAEQIQDTALKISFMPPKGWMPIPDSVLSAAVEESGAAEKVVTRFAHGYNDPEGGGVITISQLPGFDQSDSSSSMQKFKQTILSGDPQADVKLSCFYHKGWKIHQLFTQSSGFAVYKMIYSYKTVPLSIQFDFAFPVEHNEKMTNIVESVAGSVVLIKAK